MEENESQSIELAIELHKDDMQMYLKTHRCGTETLIAVCDCALMGKMFEEGNLRIEIKPDFFGDQKATMHDVERALAKATIANFIGEHCVDYAIRLGYVDQENVLMIKGIPCAQMVLM